MKQDIQQFSLRKCTCIDIECHYFDEIFIIGCTGSCQNDNFQCRHWRKFLQNVNIYISVWTLGISKSIWTYRASFCWGVWQQTMGEWWNSPQTNKSPRETIVYLERPQAAKQGKHGQNCIKNTVEVIRNGRVCFLYGTVNYSVWHITLELERKDHSGNELSGRDARAVMHARFAK